MSPLGGYNTLCAYRRGGNNEGEPIYFHFRFSWNGLVFFKNEKQFNGSPAFQAASNQDYVQNGMTSYTWLLTICPPGMTNYTWLLTVNVILGIATGLSPPSWLTGAPTWPEQDYYDENGPPVELNCKVKVDHSITILWSKDGHPLSKNLNSWSLSNDNQTLALDPPIPSQTGTYECFISNQAGNISYSNYILIAERTQTTRPRIIETSPESQVLYVGSGENATLWCMFDIGGTQTGLMDLMMNWVKNKTLVNDTDHTTWDVATTSDNNQVFYLNITNLQPSDYGEYSCVGSNSAGNDTQVMAVLPPQPHPEPDDVWIIVLGSVGGVFLIGTVTMVILLYRRNCATNKYESFDWPEPDLDHYDVRKIDLQYDVFVSYSSGDQDWVFNSLFQTMTSHNYQVCIDFKDFTPGMPITENILDAIYKSRKVIVVLSENFMKSVWGQFELSQALYRAVIQRKDVLVLIKYDSCKIPGKLLGKTYLDWASNDVRPHFWKRLFESVGEPGNYGNSGNQSDENQNGGVQKNQNGSKEENQNDSLREEQNGDVKQEGVGTERKSSTSKSIDRVVSYSKDVTENPESNVDFVEGVLKLIDINADCDFISFDSDTHGLIENNSDIIDIHAPVIQT